MNNAMSFRLATMDDVQVLFDWRNDPMARRAAHFQEAIDFDTHVAWLTQALADQNRRVYICHYGNDAVGTIRSDKENEHSVLTWIVSPQFRRRGLGYKMVREFINLFPGKYRAEVKNFNSASRKVCLFAGLRFISRENEVCHYNNFEQAGG